MDYEDHLNLDSSTVVFAFSSGDDFEFGTTLQNLSVAYVLFRSPNEGWYQNGVGGIGDINAVVDYICYVAGHHGRSVTLGLSVGSYGALMFGQLAPTTEVIAISPVTGVGKDVHPDFEQHWFYRVHHEPTKLPIKDLKPLFVGGAKPRVRAFIGDGPGTELDLGMARRIGITDITVLPGANHAGAARILRDSGRLAQLILGDVR